MIKALAATVAILAWGAIGAGVLVLLDINPWWSVFVAWGAIGIYGFFFALAAQLERKAAGALAKRWASEGRPADADPAEMEKFIAGVLEEVKKGEPAAPAPS